MSYVVLARKWRPQRFEDLVGQDHVARTLGNAIQSGRVAHAFLFTGVRGVGKTTSARILAKALNCIGKPGTVQPGTDPGPTVTPCLECPACLEITAGTDMDVREIDGASHNGVDEVRKLQDSLPYRPSRDRYKIVIVDEVHMLTAAAWNAFLKTLEEPPAHVKFIFATTEVHKVPITILSRVQRFDFKMIPARTIAARIRYVLDEEKIAADDTAISLLSRQAAGSMRDAMSLLDQVIAFSGEKLVGSDVALVLGVPSRGALYDVARALLSGAPETCLRVVGELADQGFDIPHLARDLLGLLRDLVVSKVCKEPGDLLDLSDEEQADVLELARETQESDLLRLHQAFSKNFDEVVRGADPRSSLEMLLVRLSLRPQLLPVDELLHRLAHLEKRLTDGGARPQRGADMRAPEPRQVDPPRPAHDGRERSPRSPRSSGNGDESSGDDGPPAPAPALSSAPALSPAPVPAARPQPAEPQQPGVSPQEGALLDRLFPIAERIRETNHELAAIFEQTVPLLLEGAALELGLEPGFLFEKQLTHKDAITVVETALRAEWGKAASLRITLSSPEAKPHLTLAAERVRKRKARHDAAVEDVKQNPKVREAMRILGAEIRTVRVPEV